MRSTTSGLAPGTSCPTWKPPTPVLRVCSCHHPLYAQRFHFVSLAATQCGNTRCDGGGGFLRVMSPSGYLASVVTSENGCGDASCPWVIQPKAGQRLNLTFYPFVELSREQIQSHYCHHFATVTDKITMISSDITVCDVMKTRTLSMTTSASADVEIRVYSGSEQSTQGHFVMKYEGERPRFACNSSSGRHPSNTCAL